MAVGYFGKKKKKENIAYTQKNTIQWLKCLDYK